MANILVAKTEAGNLVFLQGSTSRNNLVSMRANHKFHCPDCGSLMIMKIGDIKTPHFAHKSLTDCISHEPESSLHIQGKLLLYQFFKDRKITVEIEKYLPHIRQRADLLIHHHTAVEFQCSSISASEVLRRSSSYSSIGLNFFWIGISTQNNKSGIQIFKLMEYQNEMVLNNNFSKYLILLNPETRNFHYLSNMFYISGNRWVVKSVTLPIKKQSFPFAIPTTLQRQEFEAVSSIFLNARDRYIKSQYLAKKRYQNPLWLLCYKLQMDIRNIPAVIGVPILGAECFTEHPVVWQLKMTLASQQGRSIEDVLSTNELQVSTRFNVEQATIVLESYLSYIQDCRALGEANDKYLEVLYGIYCNNAGKLRK